MSTTTTIDKAGRVVIPIAVRGRLGLRPGTELDVVVDDDLSLRLVRRVAGPRLVRIGKRLVARPAVKASEIPVIDVARLIEEERNR